MRLHHVIARTWTRPGAGAPPYASDLVWTQNGPKIGGDPKAATSLGEETPSGDTPLNTALLPRFSIDCKAFLQRFQRHRTHLRTVEL